MRRLRRLAHLVLFCPFSKGLQVSAARARRPRPPLRREAEVQPRGWAERGAGPRVRTRAVHEPEWAVGRGGGLGKARTLGVGRWRRREGPGAGMLRPGGPRPDLQAVPAPRPRNRTKVLSPFLHLKNKVCYSAVENLGHTEPPWQGRDLPAPPPFSPSAGLSAGTLPRPQDDLVQVTVPSRGLAALGSSCWKPLSPSSFGGRRPGPSGSITPGGL
ncbi:hypothetical protein P7K49_002110 [Saguinus oedipus]|uniref:Uncharacterized protein n=1 Tax=Saguinus oedipus TaxID=9490 RepID=A0ABQ9WGG3_SAGOE|nr:hypothetical protein P7K49_002110 [Saguinus oedipus]